MEPMTMPAMAPPLRVEASSGSLLSSPSLSLSWMSVTVAWGGASCRRVMGLNALVGWMASTPCRAGYTARLKTNFSNLSTVEAGMRGSGRGAMVDGLCLTVGLGWPHCFSSFDGI